MFGHPVTVTYNGSDSFKTKLGTLCSFGVYILIFVYMVLRLCELAYMQDPNVLIIRKTLLSHQKALIAPLNLDKNL